MLFIAADFFLAYVFNFEYFAFRQMCGSDVPDARSVVCAWVVRPWNDGTQVVERPWYDRLPMLLGAVTLLSLVALKRHLTRCGLWRGWGLFTRHHKRKARAENMRSTMVKQMGWPV